MSNKNSDIVIQKPCNRVINEQLHLSCLVIEFRPLFCLHVFSMFALNVRSIEELGEQVQISGVH